jgi:hypothetical protein
MNFTFTPDVPLGSMIHLIVLISTAVFFWRKLSARFTKNELLLSELLKVMKEKVQTGEA